MSERVRWREASVLERSSTEFTAVLSAETSAEDPPKTGKTRALRFRLSWLPELDGSE